MHKNIPTAMEKRVRKYHLHDPKQIEDERKYWQSKTPEERLAAAESLRKQYLKLKGIDADQRLQRVHRIVERKKS
jgi:ribosomal protein L29